VVFRERFVYEKGQECGGESRVWLIAGCLVVERREKVGGKCKINDLVLEVYDNILLFN
jgi:hypothetical protein